MRDARICEKSWHSLDTTVLTAHTTIKRELVKALVTLRTASLVNNGQLKGFVAPVIASEQSINLEIEAPEPARE